MPGWRNWQTRTLEGRMGFPWGFKSLARHQVFHVKGHSLPGRFFARQLLRVLSIEVAHSEIVISDSFGNAAQGEPLQVRYTACRCSTAETFLSPLTLP